MSIRGRSLEDLIERRRRESGTGGARYIDQRIDFVDRETGAIWLTCGGRWDRRLRCYSGRAERRVVVRCHPGQKRAVQWFAKWIAAHRDRRVAPPPVPENLDEFEVDVSEEHVYSALFAGGRRAGKTWIAVAFGVAYGIEFPDSIVWLIGPTESDWAELSRYVKGFVAGEWLDGENAYGWELANGSSLDLKSGHGGGEGLKEGRCDFAVLNEGQRVKRRAFTVTRGAIADRAGCVLVCANPPTDAKDEQWVADFASESLQGTRASIYIEFNALLNPTIDRTALLAMRFEVDERTFAIEVLGQFRSPADAVAYNWVRTENERSTPARGDVTGAFLERMGEGAGIRQLVGIDVQRFPYIAACVYRFFDHRFEAVDDLTDEELTDTNPETVLAWVVDEVALTGGDETALADALEEKGHTPEETLLIVDASGRYQHSRRRSIDAPPPEWQGKGSFDIFRQAGFRRIQPPDRRQKRNPQIVDRVRAFTSLICSHAGVRRLFADPAAAPKTCKAIREWRVLNGQPSRTQFEAHMGDGASYPIVRLFPRRLRRDKPGQVDPVVKRVDLPEAEPPRLIVPPSFGPPPQSRRRAHATRISRLRGY